MSGQNSILFALMKILAVESSCDETALAIYHSEQGILAEQVHSQIDLHATYGGVVPELASRDHIRRLRPLTQALLAQAELTLGDLDAVAYTAGPGLVGALMVGAAFGKALAWGLNIPALAVHHMEGHLLAPFLSDAKPEFPFVALLVSGGHTQLMLVRAIGDYELLGDTLDDAVGEAFDKTAKCLGLPYPGGPAVAKLALDGEEQHFSFPRPMTDRPGLDFSFSGLKTHVVTTWRNSAQDEASKAHIAAGFQRAVVDTLRIKCKRALQQTGARQLVVAGGVSANLCLREQLQVLVDDIQATVHFPALKYCTDNAAMIAYAAYQHLKRGERDEDLKIPVNPRWAL